VSGAWINELEFQPVYRSTDRAGLAAPLVLVVAAARIRQLRQQESAATA
jgi:hypothetical protein